MTPARLLYFILALIAGVVGYITNNLIGFVAAVIFLALTFNGLSDTPAPLSETQPVDDKLLKAALQWMQTHSAFMLGVIAALCSALAAWISTRDEFSVIAIYLWLASLALLMLTALRHDRIGLPQWHAALTALRHRALALEVMMVVVLTLIAFALRAHDLDHYPPPMHGDEGEMGLMALRVLEGKPPLAFFGTFWLDHPSLFHYVQAIAVMLFGPTETGLRMLSAIFGAACVPLLYLIGRVGWGRLAGLTAAWLMTVSHLHIHYSRIALNNIESVFGMILLILLIALARERGTRAWLAEAYAAPRPRNFFASPSPETDQMETARAARVNALNTLALYVGAGLVMGFSQYMYYGSRLMPIVIAPLLLVMWREKTASAKQIAALVITALIVFAPLGVYYLNHQAAFFNRMNGVSILREQNLKQRLGPDASLPKDALPLLRVQAESNLSFFVRNGDASSFYLEDIPGFDMLTAVLIWLGLGMALTRARRYHEFALLMWFALGIIFAGMLTNDAPNAPRLIVMVPAAYLLAGVFVYRAWRLFAATLRLRREWVGAVGWGVVAALILLVNIQLYFVDYARNAGNLTAIMVAREMVAKPGPYRTYLMGAPILFAEHGVVRFVAREARARNLNNPNDLPPPSAAGEGTLVVALTNHVNDLKAIEQRFPGGVITAYSDPVGRLIYVAYRIPPDVAR